MSGLGEYLKRKLNLSFSSIESVKRNKLETMKKAREMGAQNWKTVFSGIALSVLDEIMVGKGSDAKMMFLEHKKFRLEPKRIKNH